MQGLAYPVDVQINGGAINRVDLSGDGTAWVHAADLPIGTIVRVRKVFLRASGGERHRVGNAVVVDAGTQLDVDADGWTVFTITGETNVALTVTNRPTEQFGEFQVTKTLVAASATPVMLVGHLPGAVPNRRRPDR